MPAICASGFVFFSIWGMVLVWWNTHWNKLTKFWAIILGIVGFYFLVFSVYYYTSSYTNRIIFWNVVPVVGLILLTIGIGMKRGRRAFAWSLGITAFCGYWIVWGFITINLMNFLLCSHGPDHKYDPAGWNLVKTLVWPYYILAGEHLPDEPCYWQ